MEWYFCMQVQKTQKALTAWDGSKLKGLLWYQVRDGYGLATQHYEGVMPRH